MPVPTRSPRKLVLALAATALLPALAHAQAASGDAPLTATWQPQQLRFTYLGFTSHFSCDGLRDKMQIILTQLGARREDLRITMGACAYGPGRPDPFPSVYAKFSVLKPADANAPRGGAGAGGTGGTGATPVVAVHWQPVELLRNETNLDTSAQCELLEEVRQKVVPLFTTRNVQFNSSCVPHQVSAGGARLRAEVLMPNAPGPAGSTAP